MTLGYFEFGDKDRIAQRNKARKGEPAHHSADWKRKVRARQLRDEAFARSLGVDLTYADIGPNGMRVWRSES